MRFVDGTGGKMSTGGEVANALVCKTSIRGFNSRPVLQLTFQLPGYRFLGVTDRDRRL